MSAKRKAEPRLRLDEPRPLKWYGDEDGKLGYPTCPECFDYLAQPGMIEAAASVGIEHGKSTGLMLREITDDFHARGHQEAAR